jgi:hypothetical protein
MYCSCWILAQEWCIEIYWDNKAMIRIHLTLLCTIYQCYPAYHFRTEPSKITH